MQNIHEDSFKPLTCGSRCLDLHSEMLWSTVPTGMMALLLALTLLSLLELDLTYDCFCEICRHAFSAALIGVVSQYLWIAVNFLCTYSLQEAVLCFVLISQHLYANTLN